MGAMHPILDDDFDPADGFPDFPPTLCCECDNPHPDTLGKPPFAWRCMKFPAPPINGFVSPGWRPDPPYHLCKDANRDGDCPHWTPRRAPDDRT
jgi:hypothetical protein